MRFDTSGSQLPECIVLDEDDSITKHLCVYVLLSEDGELGELKILANKAYLNNSTFDITLCHELGHVIAFRKKINYPLIHFGNILKNELAADKAGYKLFALSGARSSRFFKLYKDNFKDLFGKICISKGMKKKMHYMQCVLINMMRTVYLFFFVTKEKLFNDFFALRVSGVRRWARAESEK